MSAETEYLEWVELMQNVYGGHDLSERDRQIWIDGYKRALVVCAIERGDFEYPAHPGGSMEDGA